MRRISTAIWLRACVLACSCAAVAQTQAEGPPRNLFAPDGGKLLLTAGFNDAEGAGGGGLTPFALITGYGTNRSWGANAHYTSAALRDYELSAYGLAVGVADRIELSATRQDFEATGGPLERLRATQDIYGVKLRLFGDAIYAQDAWTPQIAVGAQWKRHRGFEDADRAGLAGLTNPMQLGATDDEGVDYYVAATKVLLERSVLFNGVVRYTKANQFGLLGFGGDCGDDYSVEIEGALGVLITRKLALGAEYRTRPRNLSIDNEDAAWDAFVAWTPTRHASIVAAWLNIGRVLAPATGRMDDQDGPYVSVQIGF